jgi:hypothetical protein
MRGWLVGVAACGRIGLDATARDGGAGSSDASSETPARIAWVNSFVAKSNPAGTQDAFAITATAAGQAFVLHVECDSMVPTTVTATAPGWTFTPIGSPFGMPLGTSGLWAASFGAIAPDTATVTLTVAWSVTCAFKTELGDVFDLVDPSGGAITFGAHVETIGNGNCAATVTTPDADDAVWAACTAKSMISGAAPKYTKASDDGVGDWSEYLVTTDPAGTIEMPTFSNTTANVMTVVTLRPR